MNEPKPTVKRSSKEILQEIKQLYKERKYDRALALCGDLVARHPGNTDLKGLYAKIEARVKAVSNTPSAPASNPPESTVYYTERAESAVTADEVAPTGNAEQLIQKGVQLYEVQDYERAIHAWEQALAVDPENTMALDYLSNVRAMMVDSSQNLDPVSSGGSADEQAPDKDQLLAFYNDGLKLYKDKDFHGALEKWEYILKYHPGHKETQECIRKTRAALEKESEYLTMLEEAEQDFRSGDHAEAERKVLHLLIKAPHLEGAQKLKESIEERKRQITEIRSLEIEETQPQHISSATDDEITRYFTPDAGEGRRAEARKVVKIVKTKKEKKMPKWVPIAALVVAVLGIGGYFGWQQFQRQLVLDQGDVPLQIIIQDEPWDSPERRAEEFASMGTDYMDEGEYLFAIFAYEQALKLAKPRLQELQANGPVSDQVVKDRINTLNRVKQASERELARLGERVIVKEVDVKQINETEKMVEEGEFRRASEVLTDALSGNRTDQALKDRLASTLEKLAFERVTSGELDEALQSFRRAAVLSDTNRQLLSHVRVIDMFYDGSITSLDRDQWFFFFIN